MTKKSVGCFLLVSFFILSAEAIGQYFEQHYDVPYVPTRQETVEQMLTTAKVNEHDTVYDLGCGDGRIVITAAKEFGAKGVGIDINPDRISESTENAIEAEVTDRVRFIEQNLFEADISEATVVTLYLLQSVNLRLRPKLFQELKPGTRIVSHDFDMGDWKPDLPKISNSYEYQTVYFWIMPANVSGTWEWTLSAGSVNQQYVLNIYQQFQEVTGTLTAGGSEIPISSIAIAGDRLRFTVDERIGGKQVTQTYEGTAGGNSIAGTVQSNTPSSANRSWNANRDPSTITVIYETE